MGGILSLFESRQRIVGRLDGDSPDYSRYEGNRDKL
jgi:hypothetical protein